MNLTPQQLETQQIIVQRSHPGLSLEEALHKELRSECDILIAGELRVILHTHIEYGETLGYVITRYDLRDPIVISKHKIDNIIGLPPCLARVLHALGNGFIYHDKMLKQRQIDETDMWFQQICNRRLLNDDGTPTNLWDQSQETQLAIHNILKSD